MANKINGTCTWGIMPLTWSGTGWGSNTYNAFPSKHTNYLKSTNEPLRFQIQWFNGAMDEGTEPSAANSTTSGGDTFGDVVNVIFEVSVTTDPISAGGATLTKIASVKKSRDITNRRYNDDATPQGHRFTIDISSILSDQLSYSLCPINKGTWESRRWGGMNGGLVNQDNVLSGTASVGHPISDFNVSKNGTFLNVRVDASFEIIDGDGNLQLAVDNIQKSSTMTVINSVNQFDLDKSYYGSSFEDSYYAIDTTRLGGLSQNDFLTKCPNFTLDLTTRPEIMPSVRTTDEALFVQWFTRRSVETNLNSSGTGSPHNDCAGYAIRVDTFDYTNTTNTPTDTFYLIDCNSLADIDTSGYTDSSGNNVSTILAEWQQGMFIQNISPSFINNTASLKSEITSRSGSFPYWNSYTGDKITNNTNYYCVSFIKQAASPVANSNGGRNLSVVTRRRWFKIDRQSEKFAFEFVRFHWLNCKGGIDSYTARRNVVEGVSISRDIIERKTSDKTWIQNRESAGGASLNSSFISDTMRGGNIYKGGREVKSITADKTNSVYTEPLNKPEAKWLQEMLLSPNVWVEMETGASKFNNNLNNYLRPSTKEYIPVLITNSEADTVNEEQGLVTFNIEYTLAHKVNTQRN
jgi:hypothetical protein|tara:strand:- start:10307 stop:12208 length:1902 start_codon:yes stop_codon:yes gene_type:complete